MFKADVSQYVLRDVAGLYGFFAGAGLSQLGINERYSLDKWLLADPSEATEVSRLFWGLELGGLPTEELGSELFRRFVPRHRGTQRLWNPIRNEMPDWMPGPENFIDFLHGDPYAKVHYGEMMLPGKAWEAIHGPPDLGMSVVSSSNLDRTAEEMYQSMRQSIGRERTFSEDEE
jgi:hypothetical protein